MLKLQAKFNVNIPEDETQLNGERHETWDCVINILFFPRGGEREREIALRKCITAKILKEQNDEF